MWTPIAGKNPDLPPKFKRVLLTVVDNSISPDTRLEIGYIDDYKVWRNTSGVVFEDEVIAWAESPNPYTTLF